MLNRCEEERSAQRVVPDLSHWTFASLEIWLRGRDLNPRPLGYEPNFASQQGVSQDDCRLFS